VDRGLATYLATIGTYVAAIALLVITFQRTGDLKFSDSDYSFHTVGA